MQTTLCIKTNVASMHGGVMSRDITGEQKYSIVTKDAVDACKQLQMSLFSSKMLLHLHSSRCRHFGLVECNQRVTKSQLVLYWEYNSVVLLC